MEVDKLSVFSKVNKLPQKLRNRYGHKRFIEEYVPKSLVEPDELISVNTAWKGLERIIPDILERFEITSGRCIEFGVEYGFSTVAFSNYFREVVGVDTFQGDINTADHGDHFESTSLALSRFENINLHQSTYQDWVKKDNAMYDLAHVDIVHTYKDTFRCGLWAAQHSKVTLFHDTESFLDVRNAVIDIAKETGKQVYNYPFHAGLGIVAPLPNSTAGKC